VAGDPTSTTPRPGVRLDHGRRGPCLARLQERIGTVAIRLLDAQPSVTKRPQPRLARLDNTGVPWGVTA